MATVRQPSMRGVTATEIPLGQIDNETRGKLGLPQQLDAQARAFGEQTRARTARASTSAPITGGAAPTGAAPTQATPSKMSQINQRATGALRSILPRGGAAPQPTPAAGPTGTLRGVPVGGTPTPTPVAAGIRGALGKAGAIGLGAATLGSAADTFSTPTETYRRRFGMETKDPSLAGDLGARALGAATDLADNLTGGFFGIRSRLDGNAPAAPVDARPRPSTPADARRATGDFDRGPTRTRDFAPELASVPRELPNDLPSNQIFRTTDANGRAVYSGRDVTESARMVGGQGQPLAMRGTVSTVPGMSRDEIDRTLGRGAYAQPEGTPTPQGGGFVASSGLLATPKARRAAEALRQGAEQLSNQRRGQDMTMQASMAEIGDRREARREKTAATAAQMARQASYVRAAGGDPALAAQLATQAGDLDAAESLSGRADAADSRAKTRNTAIEDFLKPLSTATDEDGKGRVDDALLQSNISTLQSLAPQMGYDSVQDLISDAPAARAAIKIINGINSTRENTIGRVIGLDDAPRMTQIPSTEGAQNERVGFLRGALTPNVSWGDRRFVTNRGDFYLPDEVWQDEDVQRFFNARSGK